MQPTIQKLSYIELQLNSMIYYIILLMLIVAAVSTGLGVDFKNKNDLTPEGKEVAHYIYPNLGISLNIAYVKEVFQILAAYFINYASLLPLALMINLEIIKPIQTIDINEDSQLKSGNEKFKVFSLKLQENLGAIKYIFTDKTGTLTQNDMIFHSCSIFGKLYEPEPRRSISTAFISQNLEANNNFEDGEKSLFNNYIVREKMKRDMYNLDLINIDDEECPYTTISDSVLEFLIGISLNHNILPEVDEKTKSVNFTGSSPDEVALLFAIKELGLEFIEKNRDNMTIRLNGRNLVYEILNQFDFTSERKRSSIIVKDPVGNINLYMKGADDIIFERLNEFSKVQIKNETKLHLDKFAKHGLRTLCYTVKPITTQEYRKWNEEYKEMKYKALNNKSLNEEVTKIVSNLEQESFLLGVTGLDDKLQDDVKNVIQELINADINIWMLTGDKLDTAESIGFSCKLFNDDTEIFKIRNESKEEVEEDISRILLEMERFEKDILNFKILKSKHEIVKEIFKEHCDRLTSLNYEDESAKKEEIQLQDNINNLQENFKLGNII